MGLWEDAGNFLIGLSDSAASASGAVDDFAESISSGVNEGLEAAAGALEGAGSAFEATFEGVASSIGDSTLAHRVGSGVFRWFGRAVSAGAQSLALAMRGVVYGITDSLAGAVRILGGILTFNPALILKGVGNILAGVAGAALAIGGAALALFQAAWFGEHARLLTKEEAAAVERVYRASLDLRRIRIIAGHAHSFTSGQPQYPEAPARPFTLGNRIFMQEVEPDRWISVVVHECGHVWQNRHVGTRYMAEALWAQSIHQMAKKDAYDWADELARGKTRWRDFNREAQSEFIESVWLDGKRTGLDPGEAGDFFDGEPLADDVDFGSLTAFAQESIVYVRDRRPGSPP